MTKQLFTVTDQAAGQRLDLFLAKHLAGYSRSRLKQLILAGAVEFIKPAVMASVQPKPQLRLVSGQQLKIALPDYEPAKSELVPEAADLDIIYETKQFLAVNKPSGIVVHPGAGNYQGTLAAQVKAYLQDQNWLDGEPWSIRTGLVHRLDKPTSGVILFAKDPLSLAKLSELFAQRQISKTYLAVVEGKFERPVKIESGLGRDPYNRKKISSRTRQPRPATTEIAPLLVSTTSKYSLVVARPKTGRTHQIRVHLAENGFPLVGDTTYRGPKATRLLLHAYQLEFTSPFANGKGQGSGTLKLSAPLPDNYLALLSELGFNLAVVNEKIAKI